MSETADNNGMNPWPNDPNYVKSMFVDALRARGAQPTPDNMRRIVEESRRNENVVPGLRVQQDEAPTDAIDRGLAVARAGVAQPQVQPQLPTPPMPPGGSIPANYREGGVVQGPQGGQAQANPAATAALINGGGELASGGGDPDTNRAMEQGAAEAAALGIPLSALAYAINRRNAPPTPIRTQPIGPTPAFRGGMPTPGPAPYTAEGADPLVPTQTLPPLDTKGKIVMPGPGSSKGPPPASGVQTGPDGNPVPLPQQGPPLPPDTRHMTPEEQARFRAERAQSMKSGAPYQRALGELRVRGMPGVFRLP